jgi:putative MATE family efflux protein
VFTYLILLLAAVLRGVGNSQLAFRVALLQNGLNVAINLVLINGRFGLPGLGSLGAAIGTASSQAIAVLILVRQLQTGAVPGVHFVPRLVRPDLTLARQLWRIGGPAALDMIILNASFISLVAMLGRIDNHAVAAHGIGLRIQALAFVPGMSISQAASALVGQALGRKDPDVARATWVAAVRLCLVVMGTLSAIVFVAAPWIVRIFDVHPDSAVGAYAVTWMRILGVGMPVVSIWIATSGLLQGAGDTKASLRINLFATLLVQIPASYLLAFPLGLGTFGVWLGLPIAAVARSIQGMLYVRTGAWMTAGGRGR